MEIKEVTVERGYTINLGNYESAKVGMTVTLVVGPNDDPGESYEEGLRFVEERIADALADLEGDKT